MTVETVFWYSLYTFIASIIVVIIGMVCMFTSNTSTNIVKMIPVFIAQFIAAVSGNVAFFSGLIWLCQYNKVFS